MRNCASESGLRTIPGMTTASSKRKTPRQTGRFWILVGNQRRAENPQSFLRKPKTSSGSATHGPRGRAAAASHGPGWVRLGVDIEVQLVAFLAPGGAGLVLGPSVITTVIV